MHARRAATDSGASRASLCAGVAARAGRCKSLLRGHCGRGACTARRLHARAAPQPDQRGQQVRPQAVHLRGDEHRAQRVTEGASGGRADDAQPRVGVAVPVDGAAVGVDREADAGRVDLQPPRRRSETSKGLSSTCAAASSPVQLTAASYRCACGPAASIQRACSAPSGRRRPVTDCTRAARKRTCPCASAARTRASVIGGLRKRCTSYQVRRRCRKRRCSAGGSSGQARQTPLRSSSKPVCQVSPRACPSRMRWRSARVQPRSVGTAPLAQPGPAARR
jgi:hypothetical protein